MEQKKEKELLETLSKGEVLSAEEPGELAGKEDTHVPVATATEVPPFPLDHRGAKTRFSPSKRGAYTRARRAGCCLFRSRAAEESHMPWPLRVKVNRAVDPPPPPPPRTPNPEPPKPHTLDPNANPPNVSQKTVGIEVAPPD